MCVKRSVICQCGDAVGVNTSLLVGNCSEFFVAREIAQLGFKKAQGSHCLLSYG